MNTLTVQSTPCVQSVPKVVHTSISTTVTTAVKPTTYVAYADILIDQQRRLVSRLSDKRTSLNGAKTNCESGVNFKQRSISLNTFRQSSVNQPRMAQLETLEAKMASIEVSLSNSPRRKKLLNGTSNQLIIPTTNLNSSIRSIPKDLALRELDTLRNALRDKENIIQNLKGQLTIPGLRLQNLRKNNCNNSNGNLKELSEVEKKQAEERLSRLKNDIDTKRLTLKNLKIALEKLDITDNIDVRIQQAELEYQLGREELNLLTLLEETRTLQHLLEECNKKISDAHTLYNCINSSDQLSIHAVETIFDPKSPRFGAGQNDSNPGLYVDWALEDSGLVKGDRFIEVNGKIILTKSLDDLARLLSAAPDPALIVVLRYDKSGSCQVTSSSEYHQRALTTLRCELDEVRDRADENQRTKDTLKTENIRLTHRISYLEEQVSELISRLKYTESLATSDIRVVTPSPVITSTVKTTQNVTNINISSQPSANCLNSNTNANNSGNKQPSQKTQLAVQFQKGSQINALDACHSGLDPSSETFTNPPGRSRSSLSNVSNTHIGGNPCRNNQSDKSCGHSKHKSSRGLQMSASSHDLDQRSHSATKTHHHHYHNREKDYNSETNSIIDLYRNSQHCSRATRKQILENEHNETDYYNICTNSGYKQDGLYTSGIQHSKSSPLLASSLLDRNNVMDQSYRKATRIVEDLTRNGNTKDLHDKGERDYRDYRASRHNERNMELEKDRGEHDRYRGEREREAVSHLYEKQMKNGKYLTASEKYASSDALRRQSHCNDGKKSMSVLDFHSEILMGRRYRTSESKSVEDLDSTDAPTPTPTYSSSINPSITKRLFRKLHDVRSVKSLDLDSDTSSYYNNQQHSNKISQQPNILQSRVKQRLQTNSTTEPISREHATYMPTKISNSHLMAMIKPRPMPPKKPLRLSLHRAQSLQSVESAPPSTGANNKQDKLDENGRKPMKRNYKGEGQVLTAIEQAEKYDVKQNGLVSTEVGNTDIVSRENMSNLKWTTFNQGRTRENIIYANENGHWC